MKSLYENTIYFFKTIGLLLVGILITYCAYWIYNHTIAEIISVIILIVGIPGLIYLAVVWFGNRLGRTPPLSEDQKNVLKIIPEPEIEESNSQGRGRPRKVSINEILQMLQDQGEVSDEYFYDKSDNEWEEIYKFWKSGNVDRPQKKVRMK